MGFSIPKFSLEVEGAPGRNKALENDDILPVPAEKRTWSFWTYNIFWFSAVGTVANWTGAGSFLTYGLTVWDGLLCNFFGYLLISVFMVINGRAGSVYHVGFPAYCRASFGVYGAWWPVFNRALSACVWNGVNTVTGGLCIYTFLHALTPKMATIPDHMPASSGMTSAQMAGFFIFWALTASALFLSVPKWKILIQMKLVAYFLACIGMLALALSRSGDIRSILTAKSTVHGSAKAWLIVRFTLTSAASCSTFASNSSDWQRWATRRNDPIIGQIFGFPMSNFVTSLCGFIVAASSEKVYGTIIWNPITYMDKLLTSQYDAKTRAGVAIISAGFTYAALFSCIFENVLPAGNDISALAPKYLSMKRAFGICMLATIALNPWYLLGSASIFITFISSYQIFLFSIIGVLLCDYYFVSKGRLELQWMFTSDQEGPYYYSGGVNWRAIAAYAVGVAVSFAGFLKAMGLKSLANNTALARSYYFAFAISGVAAGLTYYGLIRIWPQANYLENKGKKFREWSEEEVEVYTAGHAREVVPGGLGPAEEESQSLEGDYEKKGDGADMSVLPVV